MRLCVEAKHKEVFNLNDSPRGRRGTQRNEKHKNGIDENFDDRKIFLRKLFVNFNKNSLAASALSEVYE